MFTPSVSRSVPLLAVALLVGVLAGPQTAIGAQGDCGQPGSTGPGPVASDCLFILRVAVSLQACTPQACVCDTTGDGSTTATDALTCLKKAVGEPITFQCPCGGSANCTNDGNCANDDCVCSDCDDDLFCSDPTKCQNNGTCQPFEEGCVCVDCMTHPECLDN